MGKKYIETRKNLRKTDLEIADAAVAVDNVLNSGRNFDYSACHAVSDDGGNGGDGSEGGEGGGNEGGDDVIDVAECLANTDFSTLAQNATEVCGLTINRYMVNNTYGIRLTYPAASKLTYNPLLDLIYWKLDYVTNPHNMDLVNNNNPINVEFREEYGGRATINGVPHPQVSCVINIGASECNISASDAIRILRVAYEKQYPGYRLSSFKISNADTNKNTIRPFHDSKYYYVYAYRNVLTGAVITAY